MPKNAGLDSVGYVYVPFECQKTKQKVAKSCKLLIFFHGCTGGREFVGQNGILDAG